MIVHFEIDLDTWLPWFIAAYVLAAMVASVFWLRLVEPRPLFNSSLGDNAMLGLAWLMGCVIAPPLFVAALPLWLLGRFVSRFVE